MESLIKKLVIFVVVVLLIILSFLMLPRLNFYMEESALTNMLFAIITIASVGIGLTFSDREIEELKAKSVEIRQNKGILAKLKDELVLHINAKIKDAKHLYNFYGWLWQYITVGLSIAIVLNEICKNHIFKLVLGIIALDVLCFLIYVLILLILEKRHLESVPNQYDKAIAQIKEISEGDYTSILP